MNGIYVTRPQWELRQVLFPRSKKKRIRKKWAKNPKNFRRFYLPNPKEIYRMGNAFFVPTDMMAELKKSLDSVPDGEAIAIPAVGISVFNFPW